MIPTPAFADGVSQMSGVAEFDVDGACADGEGAGSAFAVTMSGDLEGCLYIFIECVTCMPSGVYLETGTETFVGLGRTVRSGRVIESNRSTRIALTLLERSSDAISILSSLVAAKESTRVSRADWTARTTSQRETFPIEVTYDGKALSSFIDVHQN